MGEGRACHRQLGGADCGLRTVATPRDRDSAGTLIEFRDRGPGPGPGPEHTRLAEILVNGVVATGQGISFIWLGKSGKSQQGKRYYKDWRKVREI